INVIESPVLSEIVSDINHRSNNHYAEHVYRYLGSRHKFGSDASEGADVIKSYWKSRGLDTEGLLQFDGCGLATTNAITADFMVSLLIYEKTKAKYFDEFYESLPIAGENGTVKKLLKGTKLEGKVHAKSGSISRTQCYAGYIEWDGETYAFAVMVNNFSGVRSNVQKAIENLLLSVTEAD
ncbi:MAG: D-alanyl-D-alanine carboxypeptidase, partial [Paludibacteraceae bacterium]|nr:D-alanyl-D-alanine carboxypeptidase [Paludibacteraceae bacterium]